MILVTCKRCGQEAEAPNDMAGQTVECPACEGPMKLPAKGKARKPQKTLKKGPASTAGTRRQQPRAPASQLEAAPAPPPTAQGPAGPAGPSNAVVITDIKMPFGSMVVFILKWMLASIPAMLVMTLIWFLLVLMLGAMMGGLGGLMMGLGGGGPGGP